MQEVDRPHRQKAKIYNTKNLDRGYQSNLKRNRGQGIIGFPCSADNEQE